MFKTIHGGLSQHEAIKSNLQLSMTEMAFH